MKQNWLRPIGMAGLIFLISLMSSCGSNPTQPPSSVLLSLTSSPIPSSTPVPTFSPTLAPTETPIPPTSTLTPTLAPPFPIGVFRNGVWTWGFNADGTFYCRSQYATIGGTYAVNGNQIVFKDYTCGKDVEGTYTWTFDGSALLFKVIDDPCGLREGTTDSGRWIKIKP